MTGPVIFIVRLLSLIAIIWGFSLLAASPPPPIEALVIGIALMGLVAHLWVKAEQQRVNYKRKFEKENKGTRQAHIPEPHLLINRGVEHHHHYEKKEGKSNILTIIFLISALCGIIGFLRSCF